MTEKMLFVQYVAKDMLDGVTLLKPMEELAYRRICDLIYASGNHLENDDETLAHATKTGERWPAIKARLIRLEKVYVDGDRLCNRRCDHEIDKAKRSHAKQKEISRKGVEARERKRLERNENQQAVEPSVRPTVEPTVRPKDTPTVLPNQEPRTITAAASVPSSPCAPAAAAAAVPRDLIREFDDSLAAWWGEERRRAYPHNTDGVFAQRWLDAGAGPDLCRGVFDAVHERMAGEDQDPPRTLKYHDAAIRDALAAAASPNVVPIRRGEQPYRPVANPNAKVRGDLIWEAMTDEERKAWRAGDDTTKSEIKARAAARLDAAEQVG